MAYTVFISHSARDQGLVIALANLLSQYRIKVVVADWYLSPGERLDKKVFGQIDNANSILVLLTRHGVRSAWVQQEVGYALKTKKPLIPIVEKGVDSKTLASLQGKEYIEYDPYEPRQALVRTATFVKSMRLKKEEQEQALLISGGIIAFLLLLYGARK